MPTTTLYFQKLRTGYRLHWLPPGRDSQHHIPVQLDWTRGDICGFSKFPIDRMLEELFSVNAGEPIQAMESDEWFLQRNGDSFTLRERNRLKGEGAKRLLVPPAIAPRFHAWMAAEGDMPELRMTLDAILNEALKVRSEKIVC